MLGLIMHIFQTHHHETVLHVQETRHNNVTSYPANEPVWPEHLSVSHFIDGTKVLGDRNQLV